MEDNAKEGKYDKGGRNDVKLAKNSCGAVYELSMDDNWVDQGRELRRRQADEI
ncbi:MAG: hypothetical protein R3D29_15465 [Nitratireductor sp.]